MDLGQFIIVLGCGLGIVGVPLLAGLLARTRREVQELQAAVQAAAGPSSPQRGRSEIGPASENQLQQSVDAIAVELERVSEGQRFVTKLLAERPRGQAPQGPVSDPRVAE